MIFIYLQLIKVRISIRSLCPILFLNNFFSPRIVFMCVYCQIGAVDFSVVLQSILAFCVHCVHFTHTHTQMQTHSNPQTPSIQKLVLKFKLPETKQLKQKNTHTYIEIQTEFTEKERSSLNKILSR